MLYLIATPIGNLEDISFRAISVLKTSDYILCEDTRHSKKLLTHFSINTPLKSYHKFNEALRENSILEDLKQKKMIALITDAGTPGISDPGERLVKKCIAEGFTVSSIPGPCALIHALVCSGLTTERFQFLGFIPRKETEKKRLFNEILSYPGTTIFFEAPPRLTKTLQTLEEMDPQVSVVVGRELTKKFEEFVRGSAFELRKHFTDHKPKGELVLLIQGNPSKKENDWENLSIPEHVALLQKTKSLSKKEAIKEVALIRNLSKRDVYNLMLRDNL